MGEDVGEGTGLLKKKTRTKQKGANSCRMSHHTSYCRSIVLMVSVSQMEVVQQCEGWRFDSQPLHSELMQSTKLAVAVVG